LRSKGTAGAFSPRFRDALQLLLRLALGIKKPVAAYVVLTAAATAAQASLVVIVAIITSGTATVTPEGSAMLSLMHPSVTAVLFVVAVVVAVGGDFSADRVLITARKNIAPTYFRIVADAIRAHPSRATLLVGSETVTACTKLLMGGMSLGMAVRLLLVGVVAAARAAVLLGIAFVLAGVPAWLGVVSLAVIAVPVAVGSSRSVFRAEDSRPGKRMSANKAVSRATAALSSSAEQAVLPLEIGADSESHHGGEALEIKAVADAERAIAVASDSTTRRLLISAQANFRLESLALTGFALAFWLILLNGREIEALSSASDAAPLALALLLGLRALGSVLRSLVRLAGESRTFLIRSEMLSVIESQIDVWIARQRLSVLSAQLSGAATTDVDDEMP